MQFLIILSVAAVVCSAYPGYFYGKPTLDRSNIDYALPQIINPTYPIYANQYHRQYFNQDILGQYNFAYETNDNSRSELRDAFGAVVGSYSYIDANGKLQTVNYRADENGFNAAGTNIPDASAEVPHLEPVKETPEVAAARAAHLKAQEDFIAGKYVLPVAPEVPIAPVVPNVPEVPAVPELKPIEDEPEVAKAKKEFLEKYDAQVTLLKKIESGEQELTTIAPFVAEPVTDEPAVALAKKEHIELEKALGEQNEILKSLTPATEFVQYPYTVPNVVYYPYRFSGVGPIVAGGKVQEPIVAPVPFLPQASYIAPTLKTVSPIVAETKLQEPLVQPAFISHAQYPYRAFPYYGYF